MEATITLPDVFALVDCGSLIVKQGDQRDFGSARLSSSSLRNAIDTCLESLNIKADAKSAGNLLTRLPSLRQLQTDRQAVCKGCFGAWTCELESLHTAAILMTELSLLLMQVV